MQYLHKKKLAHLDIKPANILIAFCEPEDIAASQENMDLEHELAVLAESELSRTKTTKHGVPWLRIRRVLPVDLGPSRGPPT